MAVKKLLLYGCSLVALSSNVFAHLAPGAGFSSGALHPLSGLDHLFAMVAIGILATRHGGKAIWRLPLSFAVMMLAGGFAGMMHVALPLVEVGIALSVLVLGIAIAFPAVMSYRWTLLLVTFAAFLHGHAHGTELPALVSPVLFAFGVVLSTVMLHVVGIFAGVHTRKSVGASIYLRSFGAAMGFFGIVLLNRLMF